MDTTTKKVTATAQTSVKAAARFIICGILGISIFFLKFPIAGKMTIPIDWMTATATNALTPYYNWVSLAGSILMINSFIKKKFWKQAQKNKVGLFFDLLGVCGFIMIALACLNIAPAFLTNKNILGGAINTMAKVFVSIVIIMFFIPLLTDYGMPEAIGVFVRPLCRAVWKVPGRVAVCIVSAFLGNFTVGHMQANMFYTEGKLTHREALVLAVGFSTPSIGLILSMCATAGITDKFPIIILLILAAVLIVTAITANIFPLSKYPDTYYEGVEPQPEEDEKGNPFKIAWRVALDICEKSPDPAKRMLTFGWKSIPMVSNVSFIGVGSIVFFGLINLYTPIFTLIGNIYVPVLKLLGLQSEIIAPNMGLGIVSSIAAQSAVITAKGANLATKVFGIGFVIVILTFFGSFQASLFSTKITMKMRDYIVYYFERAYLTIIVYGLLIKLFIR